ncbi:PucR family transcriptional regulator [Streptomyces iconiensis]|uniref:Helix-turn-helix domain-containing protein n=1 Tax=Streptomyces iconiensis TaxID=1384038 RepID=A0ABT6ZPE4_9ACTN|nr:helix-turn-helix domain-containing protein [Streptomyces iconiensis]MDJ1130922.1 helix-turn-helix domain-containing protein [Streptomyces iconiensis]
MHLSDEARELALRCEPQVNALARTMARDAFEDLPGYASVPGDMKDLEVAATVRHGLRLFMRRVRDPRGRHGDNGLFRERAAQRAEEGLPLHLLLRTHSRGVHVLWQTLRAQTRAGEEAALAELTDLLLRAHEHTVSAVAETYMDERTALDAERTEHHRSLLRAVLEDAAGAERGSAAELGLDGPCLVLALSVPLSGGEAAVADRRVLRRLQTVLDHAFGTEVPVLFSRPRPHGEGRPEGSPAAEALPHGLGMGRAVVPGAPAPPDDLMERLGRAAGEGIRVAAARAPEPGAVPEAASTAGEVLRVARACGLPPGLHRIEDVLLEYQLSRPSASSEPIARLLDPAGDRPELIETLRAHLEQGQVRRATARLLGVHPNTVDNRMARISAMTGLDTGTPRGAALATAALLLRGSAHPVHTARSAGSAPEGGPCSGRLEQPDPEG